MKLITDLVIFATLLIAACTPCCSSSSPAKLLLKYDEQSHNFTLGDDALREIEAITGPVKTIGAIGDARVGKSTNLNLIRYFLDGNTNQRVQKVFNTSDSVEPCTTGVWISVLRDSNGAGSTVLIDTEGTNLGNNENTDLLSIFTVLLSSGLALFAREGVQNHNVEFLYRVSRLSEQIWNDADGMTSFPELLVILREALSHSPGKTLQGQIQDFILSGKYGETIARHFPRHRTKVRDIPFVGDSKRFSDLGQFLRDDYAKVSSSLAADFKLFPAKKTISGANMDGRMIADLARKLHYAINQNSWSGFSNTYLALETDLCDRSFREIIEPLLKKDVDQIQYSMGRDMDRFAEKCALETEKTKTREKISEVIAQKKEIIEKQRRVEEERKRQAEQEIREREREQQRLREAREQEQRLDEARRARERAEEQRRVQEDNLRRAQEERRRLEAAADDDDDDVIENVAKTIVGGLLLGGIFSDSRLKVNISALPHSEFEEIGLQGYSWVWSKKAVDELGKSGIEHGVIAQEVEKLYPWAVVTGDDGYKRVYYAALKQLVLEKRNLETFNEN